MHCYEIPKHLKNEFDQYTSAWMHEKNIIINKGRRRPLRLYTKSGEKCSFYKQEENFPRLLIISRS